MKYIPLLDQMKSVGNNYRQRNADKDENGQVKKARPIPPREVAYLLEKQLEFGRIVDDVNNSAERATAELMYRDPNSGIFVHNEADLRNYINAIECHTTKAQADKIIYWVEHDSGYVQRTKEVHLVPVGNGVFNLQTQQLEKYDSYFFTSKVATNYVDDPRVPVLDGWRIDEWINNDICDNNPGKKKLFWQAMYCIVNPNDNKKGCLLLTDDGQGNTGKGTLQALITALVGSENRADLTIEEFENPFELASIANKALIIGDDNEPDTYIKSTRSLKSIIAKERILLNPKNERPYSYTVTAFIVQSMNGTPRFKDKSGALYDRFRALKLNKRYGDNEVNLDVKTKYIHDKRVLQWILHKALQVKPFARMIKTHESNEIVLGAKLNSDPVLEFLTEHLNEFKSEFIPSVALFNIFRTVYSNENGQRTKLSQRAFTQRAKAIMLRKGWQFDHDTRAASGWDPKDKEYFLNKYDNNYLNHNPGTYQYGFTIDADTRGGFSKPR